MHEHDMILTLIGRSARRNCDCSLVAVSIMLMMTVVGDILSLRRHADDVADAVVFG